MRRAWLLLVSLLLGLVTLDVGLSAYEFLVVERCVDQGSQFDPLRGACGETDANVILQWWSARRSPVRHASLLCLLSLVTLGAVIRHRNRTPT